jgi:heat shock protein HslJ
MFILCIYSLSYCKSLSTNKKSSTQTTADNSRNSLDWDGIYRGVMPCTDCQGIQTTILLNKDLGYTLKRKYLGKSDSVFENAGKFAWNNEGNIITLSDAGGGQSLRYLVGENVLMQVDQNGNKMSGSLPDDYMLSKSNYAIVEKYWKLVELNGKPIIVDSSFTKEPHIILKEKDNKVIGNGGCNNISGTYKLGNMNRIYFSQMISTQMACPNMTTESEFLRILNMVDNFTIAGDMLVLNKARMAPLARFKTVYMK